MRRTMCSGWASSHLVISAVYGDWQTFQGHGWLRGPPVRESPTLVELRRALSRHERTTSPFLPEPARALTGPNRHWVKPVLVAVIRFSEWTNDGRLRHPSFEGLRLDKSAADVVREGAERR